MEKGLERLIGFEIAGSSPGCGGTFSGFYDEGVVIDLYQDLWVTWT